MSTYIKTLKNSNGDIIYPRTKTTAIYDNNNVGLQTILNNLQTAIDTPSFSCVIITLQHSLWSNYSQTVSVPGVTSTNLAIVSPESLFGVDYQICGIYAGSQDTNTITFYCNRVPTKDIVLYVVIINATHTDCRPSNSISVTYNGSSVSDGADLGEISGSVSFTVTSDRDLSDINISGTNIGSYSWSSSTLTVNPTSYTDTSLTLSLGADTTHSGATFTFSWTAGP